MSRRNITALILLVFVVGLIFIAYTKTFSSSRKEVLPENFTFSNTQKWDFFLAVLKDADPHYSLEWESVSLPPPPGNTAEETKEELKTLVSYKDLRTPDTLAAIEAELEEGTLLFVDYHIAEYLDEKILPKTAKLLENSFDDVGLITLRFKEQFNRVRPHFLEPLIEPVIEVPKHPAYPSGHSTQAYFIAHVLTELEPHRKEVYFLRAAEVAKHREIAGVHYPSDSEAGRLLASALFELFMEDETFLGLLEEAKDEWQ